MAKDLPIQNLAALQGEYRSGSFTPSDLIAEVTRRVEAAGRDNVWILRLTAGQIGRQLEELENKRRLFLRETRPLPQSPAVWVHDKK